MKKIFKSQIFRVCFLFIFGFISFSYIYYEISKYADFINKQYFYICGLFGGLLMLTGAFRKKRDFKDIEHGSSRWAIQKEIKRFIDKDFSKNIILSQTEFLSMDGRKTRRNNHVLVIGGSGSGKSRYYAKPNIMQMNASYVIIDPKGEHFRDAGKMLKDNGYRIKAFNTVNLENSMHFNPFPYFRGAKDINRFVDMLINNTSGVDEKKDFFVKAEKLWLVAVISYIQEHAYKFEQNMSSVINFLVNSQAKDDDEDYKSPVDILFDELYEKDPYNFAYEQYVGYKSAAGKTAKSILISLNARLLPFKIKEIKELLSDDELEIDKMGDEKTALFLIIDDSDTTYNFIVALLIDIMMNVLKRKADKNPNGMLKIPVRFILDEIANVGKFDKLHILIAVLRSRGISIEMMFQNIDQLKALYSKDWATIEGNCDTTVFLGGKGAETGKYVSENLVGKATIDTKSYGGSGNASSLGYNSYSTNDQKGGRHLLDNVEVGKIADDMCIVSIRGLNPFLSEKFNPKKHKNYKHLADENKSNAFCFTKNTNLSYNNMKYVTEIEID